MRTWELGTLVAVGLLVMTVVVLRATNGLGAPERAQANNPRDPGDGVVYSASGFDLTRLPPAEIRRLAKDLTPEERRILLAEDTERAFCGKLLDNKASGTYVCRLCSLPLFASDAKFKSGTGWPSFFQPVDPRHIFYVPDKRHGMQRTEIECTRCRSHLGHVFDDGPPPTGLRFCMNSAALKFYEEGAELPAGARPVAAETAYFGGGCFWGVEDRFAQVPGVMDAVSGYAGGEVPKPSYKQVCSGRTGHAETVQVKYDPARVSYRDLLEWFFKFHDATQLNRQGPDIGTQYRSVIFVTDDVQRQAAEAYIAELQKSPRYRGRKIVTQVEKAGPFYEAEDYHQDYHARHGGSCALPR